MINRIELKEYAKAKVCGKRIEVWKGILIIVLLTASLNALTFPFIKTQANVIISLLMPMITAPLNFGLIAFLMHFDKEEIADTTLVFQPFKYMIKIFVLVTFQSLIIAFGMILFIIPGIILVFAYQMIPYIFKENASLGIIELMRLSREMMKGHKMDLFILELSFIGWLILGALTCGIAYLWILPYYHMALTKFFTIIKENFYAENNYQQGDNN